MGRIFFLLNCIFLISCKSNHRNQQDDVLKTWILNNQHQLMLDSDSLIQEYHNRTNLTTAWTSSTIANTIYAENSLGELAKKAGDSTDCIVTEIIFYKDSNKKRKIMIATKDSTCSNVFKSLILKTDSTNDFIFGKEE